MEQAKRILIADDDAGILDALSHLLVDEGYRVEVVSDGNHIHAHLSPLPDLLLLDIWMSGTNGKDICKKLKADNETAAMPILIVSANKDTERITREAGAEDFLLKPFQVDALLKKIAELTG